MEKAVNPESVENSKVIGWSWPLYKSQFWSYFSLSTLYFFAVLVSSILGLLPLHDYIRSLISWVYKNFKLRNNHKKQLKAHVSLQLTLVNCILYVVFCMWEFLSSLMLFTKLFISQQLFCLRKSSSFYFIFYFFLG